MQKMTPNPATPGRIGPLWCLHLVAAIYARLRIKGTFAAAAAHAGIKMSKKYNIEFINCGLTLRKSIKFYLGTCPLKEATGYKPSSNATQEARPQAKGSSFKPKSTSSRIRDPE